MEGSHQMSRDCLDHELIQKMSVLITELTTSGSPSLNQETMKKLKRICRTSDLYVEHVFRLLMTQLEREHAEIRLSAFQIIDELFNRSHAFRELLVSDFQNFLELTVETNADQPLPPPKAAAQKLRGDTLKAIQQWHEKYASGYKKLALGYNYLKTCKYVDFNDIRARNHAERQRLQEQEERKQKAMQAKLDKARKEISEMKGEMDNTVTEAENCIDLLLPRPESFLFSAADFVEYSTENSAEASGRTVKSKSDSSGKLDSAVKSGQRNENRTREENAKQTAETVSEQKCEKCALHTNNSSDRTCTCSHRSICEKSDKEQEDKVRNSYSKLQNGILQNEAAEGDSIGDSKTKPQNNEPHAAETTEGGGDSDSGNSFDEVMDENDERRIVQAHGLGSRKYQLEIEIGTDGVKLAETEDNHDLYRSLKDANTLIFMRYLPQVVRWLEVLSKSGGSQTEIKAMIDLKQRLEHIQSKCTELHLVPDKNETVTKGSQSDSDEDLEEVPEKEGYEPHIPAHLRAEYGLEPLPSQSQKSKPSSTVKPSTTSSSQSKEKKASKPERRDSGGASQKATSAFWSLTERSKAAMLEDPTSRAANLAKRGITEDTDAGTSSKREKPATVTSAGQSAVPTLPFGKDLAYWGSPDKIEAPTIVKNDSLHRFWVPAQIEHEKPSQHDVAAVMNRTFHYVGDFVPVKWKCRAKLPNGKLCERMDRVKCPFHGKIIARDEHGNPSNPEDVKVKQEKQEPEQGDAPSTSGTSEVPPWQDPELQAEIEAATGHDLGSQRSKAKASKESKGKGKGKGKGKKYPGLTDIREAKNTSRSRLEAKVFNKRAVKRVAAQLDAADYKRVRDKFANQFNYAYKP